MHRIVPLEVRRTLGIAAYEWRLRLARFRIDALGRSPFLSMRDRVYDDRFFDEVDAETPAMYRRLVDSLVERRSLASVVDVGCGTGIMLTRFAEHGVAVRGIEGSRAAIRRSQIGDLIVRANLERGVPDIGRFDLCLCVEVAEHLLPGSARRLISGLTRLSDVVVFTAAAPGQPGKAHVNLKPKSYWHALFAERGYVVSGLDRELREAIAGIPEPAYIHANLMTFERVT